MILPYGNFFKYNIWNFCLLLNHASVAQKKTEDEWIFITWKNCLGHNTMHKRKETNKGIVHTKLGKRMSSKNKLSDYLLWSRRVLHHRFYSWHSPGLLCSSANCVRDSGVQWCQCEDSLCQCRRRRNGLTHPQSHCVSDWSTGIDALASHWKVCCAGMLVLLKCGPTGDRSAAGYYCALKRSHSRTNYSNDCKF